MAVRRFDNQQDGCASGVGASGINKKYGNQVIKVKNKKENSGRRKLFYLYEKFGRFPSFEQ